MERIKQYFKNYPQSKECFETSNGYLFHRVTEANLHAHTLVDRKVTHWTREQIEADAKAEAEVKAEAERRAKEEAEAVAKAEAEQKAKEAEALTDQVKDVVLEVIHSAYPDADSELTNASATEVKVEPVTSVKDESNKKKGKKA